MYYQHKKQSINCTPMALSLCTHQPSVFFSSVFLRLCLVYVKYFPEMLFLGKENVFRLFGCLGIRFTENQFWCLIRSNILRKCFSFYGKSIPMFGSIKHFTKNEIRFLRKINSHVWFMDHFTENMKCLTKLSTCIT